MTVRRLTDQEVEDGFLSAADEYGYTGDPEQEFKDWLREVRRQAWEEGFAAGDAYGSQTDRHLEREGVENGEPHECKRCPVKVNPYKEEP